MNKITLVFFLAKSKTTIKGLLALFAILFMNAQVSWGQVNITPVRTDVTGFSGWTDAVVAGSTYIQLVQATSSTISPAMDFNNYTSETLNFTARTFGGVNTTENILTVSISTDNGLNWTILGTRTPTDSTLRAQAAFDLSSYNGTQVRLRFTVGGTSNSIGAGIDDISITGIVFSSGPEINVKGNSISIVDGATPATTTNGTDFGTVATSTNTSKTYTIENTGSAALVLNAPFVRKTTVNAAFTITQPVLTTIPAGGSTTFSIDFNSATAGIFDEGIEILSNDADEAVYNFDIKAIAQAPVPNISVRGNGTTIPVGDTTPTAADFTDFGSTATNINVVRTYTIENTGTGLLTVNNILMLNSPSSKYSISGISFPATIAAVGSTTFTVTFNSGTAGTFADTVLIDNNDPTDTTYNFVITATAAVLNFGVGDISIVGVTADAPDSFSFVNWVPIPAGARLTFTDSAWTGNTLLVNENTVVWENNTGNTIPVGTVIYTFDNTSGAAVTDLGTVISGNLSGISASDDNIFIYEGSAASPNFIYGLSNAAWITTGTTSSNNSYLPIALNVTNGNIVVGSLDNAEYSGALAPKDTQSSFAAYKALVNNPANWTTSDNRFVLNSVDFELEAVWEASAWTDGLIPTVALKTVIKGVYNTSANGAFSAKKLTITSAGSLRVNSGTNVTVVNEVINDGSFVVENNANLIQDPATLLNTNTGNITVNRNSSSLLRLDFTLWSSPVAGTQTLAAFSPLTSQLPSRFYTFDSTFNAGGVNGAYAEVINPTAATFSAGKGYLIRMPNTASAGTPTPFTGQFTGKPNNGDVAVALIDGGAAGLRYNLVGNPYPSTISLQKFVFGNTANIENTLWFWRKTNGAGTAYCTWQAGELVTDSGTFVTNGNSQTADPLGIIQTAQGFFVQAKSGATSLTFKNSHREASNVGQFFKTKQVAAANKIWLNATNTAGDFSQMAVTYFDVATAGLDAFDGKYINDSDFALTSNINNGEYTIQGRPTFDVTDVVALNFKTKKDGEYTIAIDHLEGVFAAGQDIYLVDSKTGSETNLKTSSYNFTAVAGVDNTRFSLKYQKALNVDTSIFSENTVTVYAKNGTLYVSSGRIAISTIQVYDLQGRLIAERKNLKATTAILENLKASKQVLLVKVSGENNQVMTKRIVN